MCMGTLDIFFSRNSISNQVTSLTYIYIISILLLSNVFLAYTCKSTYTGLYTTVPTML